VLGVSNGGVLLGGGLFLGMASGVGWMCRGRCETTYPLQGALKGGGCGTPLAGDRLPPLSLIPSVLGDDES